VTVKACKHSICGRVLASNKRRTIVSVIVQAVHISSDHWNRRSASWSRQTSSFGVLQGLSHFAGICIYRLICNGSSKCVGKSVCRCRPPVVWLPGWTRRRGHGQVDAARVYRCQRPRDVRAVSLQHFLPILSLNADGQVIVHGVTDRPATTGGMLLMRSLATRCGSDRISKLVPLMPDVPQWLRATAERGAQTNGMCDDFGKDG
jgi:hypothetical protein